MSLTSDSSAILDSSFDREVARLRLVGIPKEDSKEEGEQESVKPEKADKRNAASAANPQATEPSAAQQKPEFVGGMNSDAFKRAFNKRVGADKLLKIGESGESTTDAKPQEAIADDSDLGLGTEVFRREFNRKIESDLGLRDPELETGEMGGLNSDEFKRQFNEAVGADELLGDRDLFPSEDSDDSFDERSDADDYFDRFDDYFSDYDYGEEDWEANLDLFGEESDFEDFLAFDDWDPDFCEDYYSFQMACMAEQRQEQEIQESREADEEKERSALYRGGQVDPDTIKNESVRAAIESRQKEDLSKRYGVGVIGKDMLATEYANPVIGSHVTASGPEEPESEVS